MSWDKLYATSRWRRRSKQWKEQHPMCAECDRQGRVTLATDAHHTREYRPGDGELEFWFTPLESLCFACHQIRHGRNPQTQEKITIGRDGWPI